MLGSIKVSPSMADVGCSKRTKADSIDVGAIEGLLDEGFIDFMLAIDRNKCQSGFTDLAANRTRFSWPFSGVGSPFRTTDMFAVQVRRLQTNCGPCCFASFAVGVKGGAYSSPGRGGSADFWRTSAGQGWSAEL